MVCPHEFSRPYNMRSKISLTFLVFPNFKSLLLKNYNTQYIRDEGFFPTDQIYSERKVGSVLDLFLKFAETSLFSGLDDDLLLQPS